MEIAFLLSKEHPSLPQAEVFSVLKAEGIEFEEILDYEGLLILDIPELYNSRILKASSRLGFTHEIVKIRIKTDLEHFNKDMGAYNWNEIVKGDYAVRIKKYGQNDSLNSLEYERKAGKIIGTHLSSDIKVNLKNPFVLVRIIFGNNKLWVGERISIISKKHFNDIKPHKRPFFHPGSMSPKLARCMVNLTHIKVGEQLLDPFCGTGGILIEAGIIGARVIGSDVDPKMVSGTKKNLLYCGITDFNVFRADARSLSLDNKIDAIVTDPPYGISASTGGEKSQDLYQQSMVSLEKTIKSGGRICLATPHYLDLDEVLQFTNFQVIEQYHIRMHKSLTRVISVLQLI